MAEEEALVFTALAKKCGFVVKSANTQSNQVRFIGKVHPNHTNRWLAVMAKLLRAKGRGWDVDISKHYFLRGDVVRYGWRLIIQGEHVQQYMKDIAQVIMSAPSPKVTVEEYTLHGAGKNRNSVKNGKGASELGKARIGQPYTEPAGSV